MSEIEEAPRTYSGAFLAVIAIALLAAVGDQRAYRGRTGRRVHHRAQTLLGVVRDGND